MKKIIVLCTLLLTGVFSYCQEKNVSKTKLVVGLSGPELFHAGITQRIANGYLLGFNAGIGPSAGTVWPSLSLENRFYFGKNDQRIGQKAWFLRMGTTYFPTATTSTGHFTFNLTAGKDITFKNLKSGITIDAGVFYLKNEESSIILVKSLDLWPALRFQFYFSL